MIDPAQAARVAARREHARQTIDQPERDRKGGRANLSDASVDTAQVEARCHACGRSFTYQSPVVMGRTIPRNWCDDPACTADRARQRAAEALAAEREALEQAQAAAETAFRQTMPPKWHTVTEDIIPAELAAWTPDQSVFIHGAIGRGKTTLAAALMRRGVRLGKRGAYYRVTRLFGQAIASMNRKDVARPRILDFPLEPDVLVLDDFGALAPTPFALTLLYDLIDERINYDKGIIVTADLTLGQLADAGRVGRQTSSTKTDLERIVDRLVYLSTPPRGYRHRLDGDESLRVKAARDAANGGGR